MFIRPLSKLHLVAKTALFGIFATKFIDMCLHMLSKFCLKSAQKLLILSNKASFERGLLAVKKEDCGVGEVVCRNSGQRLGAVPPSVKGLTNTAGLRVIRGSVAKI